MSKNSKDFWDSVLSASSARAECKKCTTVANFSGTAEEVIEALREFKVMHEDCSVQNRQNQDKQ